MPIPIKEHLPHFQTKSINFVCKAKESKLFYIILNLIEKTKALTS